MAVPKLLISLDKLSNAYNCIILVSIRRFEFLYKVGSLKINH